MRQFFFLFFCVSFNIVFSQIDLIAPGSPNHEDFDIIYSTEAVFIWKTSLTKKEFYLIIEKEVENEKYHTVYDAFADNNPTADTFKMIQDKKIISDKSFYRWKIKAKSDDRIYESKYFYFYVYVDSFIVVTAEREKEKKKKSEYVDIQLELSYERIFSNKYIKTFYDQNNEVFYVPFIFLMKTLGFNPLTNLKNKTAKLFYYKNNLDLIIKFGKFEYQVGKKIEKFMNNKTIEKDKDFYISIEDFSKITDIELKIDFNNLKLIVSSKKTLPILARINKENLLLKKTKIDFNDPRNIFLINKPSWIKFNILDYHFFNSISYSNFVSNSLNISAGGEFAKGSFEYRGNYNTGGKNLSYSKNYYSLKYFFENKYISSITLGDMFAYGKFQNSILGVLIENKKLEQKKNYGIEQVKRKTVPGSEVELYLNNELFDIVKADKNGLITFDLPLIYGFNTVKYKIYTGPEISLENTEVFYVPSEMIEKNNFEYKAYFGKLKDFDEYLSAIETSYGIAKNYSISIGSEYFSFIDRKNFFPYIKNNLRFFDFLFLKADYYHNLSYNLSLTSFYMINGYFNFEFESITNKKYQNLVFKRNTYSLNLTNSFRISENYFGTNLRLSFSDFKQKALYAFLNFNYNYAFFESSLNYRHFNNLDYNKKSNFAEANFALRLYDLIKYKVEWIRNLRIGARLYQSLDYHKNNGIRFELNNYLKGSNLLSLYFEFSSSRKDILYGLIATIDFNNLRYSLNVYENSISNALSGSIIYENSSKRFFFNSFSQLGYSGSVFYSYSDENNNGLKDPDESFIENVSFMALTPLKNQTYKDCVYFSNIQPFEEYVFLVKEPGVAQNLSSKYNAIAIKNYPNVVRSFNIPYYNLLELFGTIKIKKDALYLPLKSIEVNLISQDGKITYKSKTFSDGSFYFYKILPGIYKLNISQDQLKLLGYEVELKDYVVEINPSKQSQEVKIIIEE